MEYYKNNVFEPKSPTGVLTENAVFERLQDYALTIDEKLYPVFIQEYNDLRDSGMSRPKALEKVLNTSYRTNKSGSVFKFEKDGTIKRIK